MTKKTPLWVGMLMLAAGGGLWWFASLTREGAFKSTETYPLYADFTDANGIRAKTRLQIAGIDVGKIDSISHVRNKEGRLVARVRMLVHRSYPVYANASIKKASESLLGDYRLDLDPGTPEAPLLKPEDVIGQVRSRSDLDEIQDQLVKVTHNVNRITESLANVFGTPKGEDSLQHILLKIARSMDAIEQSTVMLSQLIATNDATVTAIIRDVRAVTQALAASTQSGGEINQVTKNMASLTGKLDKLADQVTALMNNGKTPEGEQGALAATADHLRTTSGHLASVARKVDDGQGTLGRLVNDPAIAEKVEQVADNTNQLLGGIARLQTEIELRSEYHVPFGSETDELQKSIKNTLALRVHPKPDKYYIFEAVADPRGKSIRKKTTTGIGGEATVKDETVVSFNDLKFSAQFAKRYYFTTLRFGITENTGGLGFNFHAWKDRIEMRTDLYDFARRNIENKSIMPRIRSMAMVELFPHVMFQGGVDDVLNKPLRAWFLGGVLRFTDEDLRSLLVVAPTP